MIDDEKKEDDCMMKAESMAIEAKLKILEEKIQERNSNQTFQEAKDSVRYQLVTAFTDLEINDEDKTGDGDQSPASSKGVAFIYKRLFETSTFAPRKLHLFTQ